MVGIKHADLHSPTFQDLATNVGLGILLHGKSLTFKDYSPADVRSILTRAKVRSDAGIELGADATPEQMINAFKAKGVDIDSKDMADLGRPLTREELAVYENIKKKTAELEDSGAFQNAGVEFGGARQAGIPKMFGKSEPISSAVVKARPNEMVGTEPQKPAPSTGPAPTALPFTPAVKEAASDAELEQFPRQSLPIPTEQVNALVDHARTLRDIATGADINTMTEAELNMVGMTHKGDKIIPRPGKNPATGLPYVPSIQIDGNGNAIILQPAIDSLRKDFPATAEMIGMDEKTAREHFAKQPITPSEQPATSTPAKVEATPHEASPQVGAEPVASSGSGNTKGAVKATPAGAAPAPTLPTTGKAGDGVRTWAEKLLPKLGKDAKKGVQDRAKLIADALDEFQGAFGDVQLTPTHGSAGIEYDQETGTLKIDPVKLIAHLGQAKNPTKMRDGFRAVLDEEYKHHIDTTLTQTSEEYRQTRDELWNSLPDELKKLSAAAYNKRTNTTYRDDEQGKAEFIRQYWQSASYRKMTEAAFREKGLLGKLQALIAAFLKELRKIAKGQKHPQLKAMLDRIIAEGELFMAAQNKETAQGQDSSKIKNKVATSLEEQAAKLDAIGTESAKKQAAKLREKAERLHTEARKVETKPDQSEKQSEPVPPVSEVKVEGEQGKDVSASKEEVPTIDDAAHEAATSPKNDLSQPTEAQKEAGNYPKGHVSVSGMPVSIENPEGSYRFKYDLERVAQVLDKLAGANDEKTKKAAEKITLALDYFSKGEPLKGINELDDAGNGLALNHGPLMEVLDGVIAQGWYAKMKDHYGYFLASEGKDKDHVDVFIKPGTPLDYEGSVYVINQVDPKTRDFDETKTIIGAASAKEAREIYMRNYAPGWKGYDSIAIFPDVASFKDWLKNGDHSKMAKSAGVAYPSDRKPQASESSALTVSGNKADLMGRKWKPNSVVLVPYSYPDYAPLEPVQVLHDGTEEGMRKAFAKAREIATEENGEISHSSTLGGATDAAGAVTHVIAPNGKVSLLASPAGQYTVGNINAFRDDALTKILAAKAAGNIDEANRLAQVQIDELDAKNATTADVLKKVIADIAAAKVHFAAGGKVQDLDNRYNSAKEYSENLVRHKAGLEGSLKDRNDEIAKWRSLQVKDAKPAENPIANATDVPSAKGFASGTELAKPTLAADKHYLFDSKPGDIAPMPNGGNVLILNHFDKLKDAKAAAAKFDEIQPNLAKVEAWLQKPKKEGGKVKPMWTVRIPNVTQSLADMIAAKVEQLEESPEQNGGWRTQAAWEPKPVSVDGGPAGNAANTVSIWWRATP